MEREITLGNENNFVKVSPVGGTVTRWMYEGQNIIYPEREVNGKRRGGIPICMPNFGPDSRGKLPQHGWLRNQILSLESQSGDTGVTFLGKNNPTEVYPWELVYVVNINFVVGPQVVVLNIFLTIARIDSWNYNFAPVRPGFHPYFVTGEQQNPKVQLGGSGEVVEFSEEFSKSCTFLGEESAKLISSGKVVDVRISERDNNIGMVFWTDNLSEYFCVEPITKYPQGYHGSCDGERYLATGDQISLLLSLICYK